MRKITQKELDIIIENHQHWIKKDCEGWENMRADLSFSNLSFSDLSFSDLSGSNLSFSDLSGSNLSFSDLSGSNLSGSDLSFSNLSYSNLSNSNLSCSNLRFSNLSFSNLRFGDLSFSDLSNSNLRGSDLSGSDLRGSIKPLSIPLFCPSDGAFTAWKKVSNYLVKLEIPDDARRSSATTNKCRANKAEVLGIYNLDGTESELTEIVNTRYTECVYRVGEMVYPDSFDEDRWNECSHGIHFFINNQEAIGYNV